MPKRSPSPKFPVSAATPCVVRPIPSIAAYLAEVPDTRSRQGLRHPLAAVLCLMMAALLSGRDHPKAISEWGRDYPQEVMAALGFRNGTPCPSTLHEVLKRLDWKALERQLRHWAEAVLCALGVTEQVVLAADGKTLRGSLKQGSEVTHLLSVVVQGLGITLSHEEVSRKSNEIPALPTLLSRLILAGRVITMDALLTQRGIAKSIVEAGADYVMVVKGNQPALEAAIAAQFARQAPTAADRQEVERAECSHGRREWRRLCVLTPAEGSMDWPGVAQVFMLERATWRGPARRTPRHQQSVVYGITSLPRARAGAEQLLDTTRGHWTIENRSHWIRDCVFGEDASQTATGAVARALAALRTATVSVLRAHHLHAISRARRRLQARPWECLALLGIT